MAELAIASGIAGLISLAIETVKVTCAFSADIASAERTVLDYLVALRALEAVLIQLRTVAKLPHIKQLLANRPQALSPDTIRDCQCHLLQIRTKLQRRMSEDGHLKLRHTLCWPLKKKETQESLEALQQYRDTFHAAVSTEILTVSVATYEEVRDLKVREIRKTVLEWLTSYDVRPTIQAISQSRHPDTCQWIFDCENYKEWVSGTARLLWCHGDPGCGKTVLSSAIVEQLSKTTTTLCHFCDHQSPELQKPEAILRNLIKQTASREAEISSKLLSTFEAAQKDARSGDVSKGQLLEVFEDFCTRSKDIYVIVDALDECDNRRQLIQLLFSLTIVGAKVLVTSRTTPDFKDAFATCSDIVVCASNSDLQAFIKYRLDELEEDLDDSIPVEL